MALTESQKNFIRNKVRELGSMGEVAEFYSRNDEVCKYAMKAANEVFLQGSSAKSNAPKEYIENALSNIQIPFDNVTYTWTGKMWHDSKTYLEPPKTTLNILNALLLPILEQEDEKIYDVGELLERAKTAKAVKQYHRALKLTRRALRITPSNLGALAILSSTLRAIGEPQQALDETKAFANENYSLLLISRAAALCDLNRWEEAKKTIGRVLAAGEDRDVFGIVNRIKAARPDLYK